MRRIVSEQVCVLGAYTEKTFLNATLRKSDVNVIFNHEKYDKELLNIIDFFVIACTFFKSSYKKCVKANIDV